MERMSLQALGKGLGLRRMFVLAACLLAVSICQAVVLETLDSIFANHRGYYKDFRYIGRNPNHVEERPDDQIVDKIIDDSYKDHLSMRVFLYDLETNCRRAISNLDDEDRGAYVQKKINLYKVQLVKKTEYDLREPVWKSQKCYDEATADYKHFYDTYLYDAIIRCENEENIRTIVDIVMTSLCKYDKMTDFIKNVNRRTKVLLPWLDRKERRYVRRAMNSYVQALRKNTEADIMYQKWQGLISSIGPECDGIITECYTVCLEKAIKTNRSLDEECRRFIQFVYAKSHDSSITSSSVVRNLLSNYKQNIRTLSGNAFDVVTKVLDDFVQDLVHRVEAVPVEDEE